ncbi:hypothetical protein OCU04_004294 [Sclerotinia nivalis]|uniref:BTB domain-containing protein n=1 Tax=Sclerotinia nivalis TaxID=352851 RepID=A0A9X0AR01_9HELO|nr:hypothetical protein OCU04_004294 [Sclerotinia nivalis]
MSISENSDSHEQALSAPVASRSITLQVGERRFITTFETLTSESAFFAALLSGRWNNTEADGSYFIDADPDLFSHILRYLRRGIPPLFYNHTKGHDHALYHTLLQEVKYFQIHRLEKWLQDKKYLSAVKLKCSVRELDGLWWEGKGQSEFFEEFRTVCRTKKVYVCPRGISVHRGNPRACGRQCANAQGDEGNEYEDEQIWNLVVVRRQVVVDWVACLKGLD